jgi:hypothetical protein
MYCLRWWIPLFLFPFPKTSPFFLVLFLVSFTIHSKPCTYCALILTGLFATSGSWYTTGSTAEALVEASNGGLSVAEAALVDQHLSYGWLNFGGSNSTRFFAPLLRRSSALAAHTHPDPAWVLSLPGTRTTLRLPKRVYIGLGKHHGLGFYLDLAATTDPALESLPLPSPPQPNPTSASVKHTEL